MENTLLAHLYKYIKGSQEDIATYSLQFILSTYSHLKSEFERLVSDTLQNDIEKKLNYICQVVGEDSERPDMAGYDDEGKEIILCEAKFYAGLTSNQPVTYISRLIKESGQGLIFICPHERILSLWHTIQGRCKDYTYETISATCIDIDGVRVGVISWEELIDSLLRVALAEERSSISDLEQLDGYIKRIISEAFEPLSEEKMGSEKAKEIENYLYLIDRVTDSILSDNEIEANVKGLKAAPYRHGYKRFIYIEDFGVDFRFDLQMWQNHGLSDTPFWICFKNKNWKTTDCILEVSKKIPKHHVNEEFGNVFWAIEPPYGMLEDEAVEYIKKQIIDYMDMIVTITEE